MKQLTGIFAMLFLLANCSQTVYQTASYDAYAPAHNIVAVLPVKTVTTGRIPPEWTDEMIRNTEENESEALQIALFDEVSTRSGNSNGDIHINLQHYTDTNAKLTQAGYTLRQSWDIPASDLAAILGVDAVVRSSVKKEQFLTDLESLGMEVATTVFTVLNNSYGFRSLNKTSEIHLSCAILDANEGIVIWNTKQTCDTDWSRDHSEITRSLARKMANRFPYRENY